MKIYDISMLIEPEMMVYKDLPTKKPVFENAANFTTSKHFETKMHMDIHCGTHIDMPLHMVENGKTMDTFDFRRLMTPCCVYDLSYLKN